MKETRTTVNCRTCPAPVFPKLIAGRWLLVDANGDEHMCNESKPAVKETALSPLSIAIGKRFDGAGRC